MLNSDLIRNTRIRMGLLSSIWKSVKINQSMVKQQESSTNSKDAVNGNGQLSSRRTSLSSNTGYNNNNNSSSNPTLADLGCQTAFTVAVSFLKSCWRQSNADFCSDVLQSTVEALDNLPLGSLHQTPMSQSISRTLQKAKEFLRNVAKNELQGVQQVPVRDRQLALMILLQFSLSEGSLLSILEMISLLFELTTNDDKKDGEQLKNVPLKPALLKVISQIQPKILNQMSNPASDVIRKSEVYKVPNTTTNSESEYDENEEHLSLKNAAMVLMASTDCLVQPLLSKANDSILLNSTHSNYVRPRLLGWGISDLITTSDGQHEVSLEQCCGVLNAKQDDLLDISASQYFLVLLLRDGYLCQVPMCDLSPEFASNAIAGANGDSCILCDAQLISVSCCPSSTNCLALTNKGEVLYWDALPTGCEPVTVTKMNLEVKAVKIAAGFMYQAVLTSDGLIYIWGRNQHGQLGTGSHQDESMPVEVAPIRGSKWVDISLSASAVGYTAAVNEDGHVYTWGGGSYWRLGHGASFAPLRILSVENIAKVFAGDNFTAAISKQGKLEVWGRVFGDNHMPHEKSLIDRDDSIKQMAQNSNRIVVVTNKGHVILYGRDFSGGSSLLSENINSQTSSFFDDPSPNRGRLLTSLNANLSDPNIEVKITLTPLAAFVLVTKQKLENSRGERGQSQPPPVSLTSCFKIDLEHDKKAKFDILLNLFEMALENRDSDLCVFVIDTIRAHSPGKLNGDQRKRMQKLLLQMTNAQIVEMSCNDHYSLAQYVDNFVSDCWSMIYTNAEDRLHLMLTLVQKPMTCISNVIFKNLVEISVHNGDFQHFVQNLIQSEHTIRNPLDFDDQLANIESSDTSKDNETRKETNISGSSSSSKKFKNCFSEDSNNEMLALISKILSNDRRMIASIAGKVANEGLALKDFYSIVDRFKSSQTDEQDGCEQDPCIRLISQFIRQIFSHIVHCSCAGSSDGCPATSICRGVILIRDFVTFFTENCLEVLESVLMITRMSPSYLLHSCEAMFKRSIAIQTFPELTDSFLSILLFSKHHFIGSDNGKPLSLFLVNSFKQVVLNFIEIDASFARFEQWLDCYFMSWQSALPSRTLHQRFKYEDILKKMPQAAVIHGCVLDLQSVTSKDLRKDDVVVQQLHGREITPIFMAHNNEDVQNVRYLITRYGVGRVLEDVEGDSSTLAFAEQNFIPNFREITQSALFALALFSVEVLSQEPTSQFPEEMLDLVDSGLLRSSLVSDSDQHHSGSIADTPGDFVSSLSGQRPNSQYAENVDKMLLIFDQYLQHQQLEHIKTAANENVALRAVKRYSLAVFVRHLDLSDPIDSFLKTYNCSEVEMTSHLPITSDCFRSVAAILQHIVKLFQQQNSPTSDHSAVCSPVFFALRFLLNSVDQAFNFQDMINQRFKIVKRQSLWRRIVKKSGEKTGSWDDICLFLRDKVSLDLYRQWQFGHLDEHRLVACSKIVRFVQTAKISQITELKLRFRMHIELASSQAEAIEDLHQIFEKLSQANFTTNHDQVAEIKAVPHLFSSFLMGLNFAAVSSFKKSPFDISSSRIAKVLSRKTEMKLEKLWARLLSRLIDAFSQVAQQFLSQPHLSIVCPVILLLSTKCHQQGYQNYGFLNRLVRVLSSAIDHNGGERLKTVTFPKCVVYEPKIREKKTRRTIPDDSQLGPEILDRLQVGTEVVRGPHWCWGDQDANSNGDRSVGIVMRPVTQDGWVRVQWPNGITNNYRMGRDGRYDLQLARESNEHWANCYDDEPVAPPSNPIRRKSSTVDEDDDDDDEEFHSIESGAESVYEGNGDGERFHESRQLTQPMIALLTSVGQSFMYTSLKQTMDDKTHQLSPRFTNFLLGLFEQYWQIKLREVEIGEIASTLTLSGADCSFRDIYGFALLHEAVKNPVIGHFLARNEQWISFMLKTLKSCEGRVLSSHPNFFIACHFLVIIRKLFENNSYVAKSSDLFDTIFNYLKMTFEDDEAKSNSSTLDSKNDEIDIRIPSTATYVETVRNHVIQCIRMMYEKNDQIEELINLKIENCLKNYSEILDSFLVKNSGKTIQKENIAEILPVLALMGLECEGRPYCGAEIDQPVEGVIQVILPKSKCLVLTLNNGNGSVNQAVNISKCTLKPMTLLKIKEIKSVETFTSLILKHISILDFLDRLILLGGVDSSVVGSPKKALLYLSVKYFMQFLASPHCRSKISFNNQSDFLQFIKAVGKNSTVRPKYSNDDVKFALTPLIEFCKRSLVSTPTSVSPHSADDMRNQSENSQIESLQTLTIENSMASEPENEVGDTEVTTNQEMEDISSDDDTVTTIEYGELASGSNACSWEPAADAETPTATGQLTEQDDPDVERLVEMGFSRAHIFEAYTALLHDTEARPPNLDQVVNWLVENPSLMSQSEGADDVTEGNLRSPSRQQQQPMLRSSLGRLLASTLVADDVDDSLTMMGGASSSSTSVEDVGGSSGEEQQQTQPPQQQQQHQSTVSSLRSRLRPSLMAFGRTFRRGEHDQSNSAAETSSLIPGEITENSQVCVGQLVKSLARIDKVVFGETGYVLRTAMDCEQRAKASTRFRPLNRLIGTASGENDSPHGESSDYHTSFAGSVNKKVLVHWRLCGLRLWVSSFDVQPIAWPWDSRREIEIGDSVKVRESVTTPRYKWGSVTHGSIGSVVALLDDLVYVNFQAQSRWAGLRKELEIIPSDAMVICYECDGDINTASDTIYYRCRKCRPPDFFFICASCKRRLAHNSHCHGLFAFVKTRGSIFNREERGNSTFKTLSTSRKFCSDGTFSCVTTVDASSNVSMLKKGSSWQSQQGVNPPHWIQFGIKSGIYLESIQIKLDAKHPDNMPMVLVLRTGQNSSHLRTIRTYQISPDVAQVELLPKPLQKQYGCIEIRIPGTRGGLNSPCRILDIKITPRTVSLAQFHEDDEEDLSSDSKRSQTLQDEDEILVLSSSDDDDDEPLADEMIRRSISQPVIQSSESIKQPNTVVFGFGLNDKDQLARHGPVKVKQVDDPLPFTGLGVVSLAFGSKCSFFLANNGRVYACGDATNGRLGLGEVPDTVSVPRQLMGELSHTNVVKVAVHSGGRHALALSNDGRVFSWGDGENGKLGHGDETTCLEPKLIRHLADQQIKVVFIACGSGHSACIDNEGNLYTWGLGEFGRLGHGDAMSQFVPKKVEFFHGKEVLQVACGSRDAQTLVLTADEQVWSFGDGDFGKLGRGGNESSTVPTTIPDLADLGICQIECGAQFSLARTKTGKVYTFGKGDYYRLGHGTESHYRRPQRVVGGGLNDETVVHVAVGALHCLALCSSGRAYLWGDGDHYQQGNGSATANRVPTLLQGVPEGYKIISASCGSSHTGVVCLLPGERDRNDSLPRLASLSGDFIGTKAAPLPFTVPFDPLGQTMTGLVSPNTAFVDLHMSMYQSQSSTSGNQNQLSQLSQPSQGKQSLAYKILAKTNEGAPKGNNAYIVHLLRTHIISSLRNVMVEIVCKQDSNELFEKLLNNNEESAVQMLSSFTRLFKLANADRLSSQQSKRAQILSTLQKVLKTSTGRQLLDTYLPELTEIACVSSVNPKQYPLDALPPIVQESPHPYAEKTSLSGSVSIPGATSLRLVFDSQCSTEKRRDVLSICDYAGRIVSLKSGRDWQSDWATPDEIIVEGDFLSWTFQSDAGSPAGWGFRFFVTCPSQTRQQQLLAFSDRKICSQPSLQVIASILPTATPLLAIEKEEEQNSEEHFDKLALFLNSVADIAKSSCIAPSYRNWAVSMCAEICLSHKQEIFIERPLAGLANLLQVQYEYEEAVVRPGRHLVFSVFCRKLVSLALAMRFDKICPVFEQASWFQRLVQFVQVAKSLSERQQWPDWFQSTVNFRIASSNLGNKPLDKDKDSDRSEGYLDNSKFSPGQDEQLVVWYNQAPEDWTLSEAAGWRVFAFGHNHRGQLALADGPKVKTPSSVPLIEQLEPVQICGGEQSSFIVTREGKVYSFGFGAGGRLGLGGADSVSVPSLLRALNDVQIVELAVSCGGKHCLARSMDGQVWSWGDNPDGALGHGNRLVSDQPKLIEFFRGHSVSKVAAGSAHSAAITADGQLYTWGRGRYGRLGHGDSEDQLTPFPVAALREHIVTDVACGSGDAQTLALTADGSVWSFGDGDYGKLGRGGSDGCRIPMIVPSLSDKDVMQVACGSQFSACLTRQGAVYTWGKGEYFRLGQGTTDHVRTPRRVAGLLGKKVVKMAVGSLHCLVLTADGEVYAFGDNDEGQLGDGSTQPASRPRLVSVLRNRPITHISAGSAHSFAWTVPSMTSPNVPLKPVIRYPTGNLPVECPNLEGFDRLLLRNRLLVFELFSENFWQSVPLLRFLELPDDFPNSDFAQPLSASKLAPFLLLPHKEATLRRVVNLTTTRDRQHGPVISIDRVSRRAGTGQTVFDQLSSWLPTLLAESSLFLANRCWKVRFVAESVDDCGGGFSDSIADACEEVQSGLTDAALPFGGHELNCPGEDGAVSKTENDQLPIVFKPNGKPESLRFLGVLMGIAIRTGSPLNLSIAPAMWRLLTSAPNAGLNMGDLHDLDPSLFNSLHKIAQMSDDVLEEAELPLAVPDISGNLVPLLGNTQSLILTITPQNRESFINAAYTLRQHEFDEAFRFVSDGLGRVVPLPLLRLFSPSQLEWLVCGSSDVSVDVLRSITSYRGGLDASSPLVRWFWDVVEEMRPSERFVALFDLSVLKIIVFFFIFISGLNFCDSCGVALVCLVV